MPTSGNVLPFQSLLDQLGALSYEEWRRFKTEFLKLSDQKRPPSRRDELLDLIQFGGPGVVMHQRMIELHRRVEMGEIPESDYKEMMTLTDLFQGWSVERFKLIIELAELEKLTVEEVMKKHKLFMV